MLTYTVFEHTEVDEPKAQGLPLDQAFARVCEVAGFIPQFRREGGVLILEFADVKGLGREHEPFRKAHPIVARARRELMQEAISKGVWGVHAATDERWRVEMNRTAPPTERDGVPLLRKISTNTHTRARRLENTGRACAWYPPRG